MEKRLVMLVVDDIEVNRVSLRETFLDKYEVLEADNGITALETLHKTKVDIVILDLFMPRMDGFEVIRQMKREKEFCNIPIIVKTAIDEKTEVEVLELGADDFIFSPYDPAIIKKRVNNIVEKYILEKEKIKAQLEEEQHMNHAKEIFLARMSHELRTPINGILGIAQLARYYENDPKKVQEAFRKVKDQAEYLRSLVNDILDMAAIDNEKLVLHPGIFQLNSIVSSVSDLYYALCKQQNVSFSFDVSEITKEYLIGDSVRIKQILINLLSNASKFTPEGGKIQVLLSEKILDKKNLELQITVKDTGCGIKEEALQKIWEPFEQEEHNLGGSGLGLPIIKNIVKMMNGKISVVSVVDEGSTFEVVIPLEYGVESKEEQRKFQTMRAYIIDQDEIALSYQTSILSRLGIYYEASENCERAYESLVEAYEIGNGFDICFINWQISGTYGKKLVEKIRQKFDRDTLLIVVSSYNAREEEDEMRDVGADYILSKPVLQSKIYNLMTSICKAPDKKEKNPQQVCQFPGKHILLAEDNAINAEVLSEFLKLAGVEVTCVSNGKKAVEAFQNEPEELFDLILMDVNMPVMDGYEATRKIREIEKKERPKARPIPIVAVSANAFSKDIIKSHEAGMDVHLVKPIEENQLFETLKELMQ